MALKLVVTTNVNGDVFELILKKARYRVGRRHDNDLRIKESYISGYHSELNRNESGDYELSDAGASNGTFLNGRRVEGAAVVQAGDFIKFGILKVAVQEHKESGPKIVSLKDRPAFAKKRNELTSAISVAENTGSIASANAISGPSEATGSTPSLSATAEQEKLRSLLNEQTKKAASLKNSLNEEKSAREKLETECNALKKQLETAAEAVPLQATLESAETEVERLNSDLKQLKSELRDKENALQEQNAEREKFANESNASAKQLKSLEATIESLKAESEALKQEVEAARSDAASGKSEANSSQERAAALRREIIDLKAEAEAGRRDLASAEAGFSPKVEERDSAIAQLEAEVNSLLEGLSGKESAPAKTAKEVAKLAALAATVDSLNKDLSVAKSTSRELQRENAEIEKLTQAQEAELTALGKELEIRDSEIASLHRDREEFPELRRKLEFVEEKVQKATEDAARAEERFEKELKEKEAANRALESSRKEMQAALDRERNSLSSDVKAITTERNKLAATLARQEELISSQKEELTASKESLKEKTAEIKSVTAGANRAEKLHAQVESLKEELAMAKSSLIELSGSEKSIKSTLEKEAAELAALQKQFAAATEAKSSREETLASREKALKTKEQEAEELRNELEALRNEAGKAEQETIAKPEARLSKSEEELEAKGEDGEKTAAALAAAITAAKDSLHSEVEAFRNSSSSATREAATTKEKLISLKAELAGLRTQLKQQTDTVQTTKAEANQLRLDLQKSREEAAKNYSATEQELTSKIAELETALASEKVRAADGKTKSDALLAEIERLTSLSSETSSEADQLRKRVEEVSKQNGQLQAQLNKESAEAVQLREQITESSKNLGSLRIRIDSLEKEVTLKEQELEEKEQEHARAESDTIVRIKREPGEAMAARESADQKVEQLAKDKAFLNNAFEHLKEQLRSLELANREAKEREEAFNHDKGLLARRLEKAEAGNSELAARIKEDAAAAIANRELIQKLESQLHANESESVRIEREKSSALKTEISRLERQCRDQSENTARLQEQIAGQTRLRNISEENGRQLQERVVALESEEASMKELLHEVEKNRASLSASLEEQTELATKRGTIIAEQKRELADTITRFRSAETSLLEKHRDELEALDNELREQRKYSTELAGELENTRIGLSDTLRSARDQAGQERAKILADGNAKLSQVEDELSLAMSSREEIELSRNALKDELNEREERNERLVERVEDIDLKIRDEAEARETRFAELEKTKAGFSSALSASWKHLALARNISDTEKKAREKAEAEIVVARAEISQLEAEAEAEAGKARVKFEKEINDWENRFDQLREEKLTLASEDASLKRIRDRIHEAQAQKKNIEADLSKLSFGMKNFQIQHAELESQKDALLKEREELKEALNAARLELDSIQRRQAESQSQEVKLAETIDSAERRIQSLKKLETQMEQAMKRKRQSGILSRSDVFSSNAPGATLANTEFSEEEFYRKLITKLDLIDDISKRYDNRRRYPKVSDQLSILKKSFLGFLHDHSVHEFRLDPRIVLSVEERKRIKLVPPDQADARKGLPVHNGQNGNSSRVVQTVRPGYLYKNGSAEIVIRKAEVIVG